MTFREVDMSKEFDFSVYPIAANALLLAMSTLSFAHYFRPRHTVPGGRIPLLF